MVELEKERDNVIQCMAKYNIRERKS